MRRFVAMLLGCLAAAFGAGCGGSDKGTEEPAPQFKYPTEADFCEALAKAECTSAVVTACYGSDSMTLADDQMSCVAAREGRCNPDHLPYHPELAEGCVTARGSAIQDAAWTHEELAKIEAACLPVFSKQQSEGAVCGASTDCATADGLLCVVKLGNIQGVCEEPVVVGGGESCADPAEVCDAGFYCDPKVSHCLANPKENEDCSAAAPCAPDFYCTDSDAGVCTAKTKNGLDCTKDEVCAGGFCVGATAEVSGKCSATLPLQITSTACDVYRQ